MLCMIAETSSNGEDNAEKSSIIKWRCILFATEEYATEETQGVTQYIKQVDFLPGIDFGTMCRSARFYGCLDIALWTAHN